ncbi:hypothetical protein [Actinomadura sp. WMMB 499]|uniref:hypothetical protein n=1 Tax=Actinomadura sp. WMMB 499 TaxID=1219491 RepID=UPI00159DCC4E|nr:hypothetical protein [Actinomadura sp. WMMB 499]
MKILEGGREGLSGVRGGGTPEGDGGNWVRDHGAWSARHDAPAGRSSRRRQPTVGPFKTKKAAQQALTAKPKSMDG